AEEALRALSQDPSVQELLRLRQDAERTRATWREEALSEGRVEGQLELLARLIAKRFGGVAALYHDRLIKLSPEGLNSVTERLLTAESLEELLGAG
ncbi:MAG TPA: DUF4351 domain-containing protein, partial [Promineifilum sp.]|nr:DUF4351 domain-containing protein [Promineifilum sp.]